MTEAHFRPSWDYLTDAEMGRDAMEDLTCAHCGGGVLQGEDEMSTIHFPNGPALEILEQAGLTFDLEDSFCDCCGYELQEITRARH